MNLYSVYDLSETLKRIRIDRKDIKKVLYAWGECHGPSTLWGDYDKIKGESEWWGGFILLLKTNELVYINGYCDYTGWGCVDSAEVMHAKGIPMDSSWDKLKKVFSIKEAIKPDNDPIDLNRWINKKIELDY